MPDSSLVFPYLGALKYVEDFMRAWNATVRDPGGRATLTRACQQAQLDGQDRGGLRCCGTTDGLHNPWCEHGPRRYRAQEQQSPADEVTALRRAVADRDAKIARLQAEVDAMGDVPVEYVTEAGLQAAMTVDPGRADGTVLRETNGARRAFRWDAKTRQWVPFT